jgi:hypothetical protein
VSAANSGSFGLATVTLRQFASPRPARRSDCGHGLGANHAGAVVADENRVHAFGELSYLGRELFGEGRRKGALTAAIDSDDLLPAGTDATGENARLALRRETV